WLVTQQNPDGSWGNLDGSGNPVPWENYAAKTGLALVKLQERAYELAEDDGNIDGPFDDDYEYSDEVLLGWTYIFTSCTYSQPISVQDHTVLPGSGTIDDPDTRVNGYGVYFGPNQVNYSTGICLMALGASGTPNRLNDGGLDLDGDLSTDTFSEIAQDTVDWLAWAQSDDGPQEGGWGYSPCNDGNCWADQSNSGYSVLGLAYGEQFSCTVPNWVRQELEVWIDNMQLADGSSSYAGGGSGNLLRTSNLIFQMTFVGDAPSTPRFQSALAYIEDHWKDMNANPGWGYSMNPANYQAMYCLMKSLGYSNIELIDIDGDGDRDDAWLNQEPPATPAEDFSSVIVQQGIPWQDNYYTGDTVMGTLWALLTLEFVFPDITPPEGKCIESVNPHGNIIPGKNRGDNGKPKGINPDGFYQLLIEDNADPDPDIFVGCRGCAGQYPGILPFGPFKSGVVIKFTEAPGAIPSIKKIGSKTDQADSVEWHITLPSEPVVIAVDASGNKAFFPCFVPPPPK
ncbi:hypothetical protein ACFLUP_04870, partial [Chloroflexota bacterium]